jgi:hypothetical protein
VTGKKEELVERIKQKLILTLAPSPATEEKVSVNNIEAHQCQFGIIIIIIRFRLCSVDSNLDFLFFFRSEFSPGYMLYIGRLLITTIIR